MADLKTEEFELRITAGKAVSTDPRFRAHKLLSGGHFKPLDAYFVKTDGTVIRRARLPKEPPVSVNTLPLLICQVFEDDLAALSGEEREDFPICQYTPDRDVIRGIYPGKEDYEKAFKENYKEEYEKQSSTFCGVTYTGGSGRRFFLYNWNLFSSILFVRECIKRFNPDWKFVLVYREKTPEEMNSEPRSEDGGQDKLVSAYSSTLIESKNLIFHGAPGTGKSYLAKQIAADVISGGQTGDFAGLSDEQKEQVGFVQFHPSYDYTDFVEGLRPVKTTEANAVGFELRPGVFKQFADRARKSYEDGDGKKYVFIIDEINRGEISKIFGELFFSLDPGYRGPAGEISTQYAYMHGDPDEKFYIPDNVYIIGTMNDIDRSVDSFDFAMRRRFRFVELKAKEQAGMLDVLGTRKEEAIRRMEALNREIAATPDLNENYQIGPAYFLKLKELNFDFGKLWTDHLQPLLREYVRGMDDEKGIMDKFAEAYGYQKAPGSD